MGESEWHTLNTLPRYLISKHYLMLNLLYIYMSRCNSIHQSEIPKMGVHWCPRRIRISIVIVGHQRPTLHSTCWRTSFQGCSWKMSTNFLQKIFRSIFNDNRSWKRARVFLNHSNMNEKIVNKYYKSSITDILFYALHICIFRIFVDSFVMFVRQNDWKYFYPQFFAKL